MNVVLMKRKKIIAVLLTFIFLFLFVNAACADDDDELKKAMEKLQEEYEKTSGDKSLEDWMKDKSKSMDINVNVKSDDKGEKSGDKKADNKLVWAQEPSQIAIALLTYSEMKTLDKILEDQDNMLKKWDKKSSEYNEILNSRNKILENIKNARDTLANSTAFNHLANNIDSMMQARYPAWKSKMTIEDAAKRINERQTKWKASVKDYLKSMNANTSHYADEVKMRDNLMKILKKPDGQIQAIQAIGGYFDNMHMTLTRDEQVLQSLIALMIERRIDVQDERNDLGKAVNEAGAYMKNFNKNKTAKKVKLGFIDKSAPASSPSTSGGSPSSPSSPAHRPSWWPWPTYP